jgi:hypothetical protein
MQAILITILYSKTVMNDTLFLHVHKLMKAPANVKTEVTGKHICDSDSRLPLACLSAISAGEYHVKSISHRNERLHVEIEVKTKKAG